MADQLLDLTAFAPSSEPVLDLEQFAPPKPAPAKKPGILIPSVKRTAGQMVGATGVALEDLGLKTRLPEVGEAIVEANPAQIQKPSDILEKPGTFLGESVSEMLPQLGAFAAGAWGGAKVGGRLGAFLGPKGAVAGAGIGGLVGGLAPIFTQEYGEIRETQKKEGAESIPKALLGATAATALERLGAEKLVGRIVKGGGMELIKEGVSRPLHMLKRGAIGALVEGPGTEFPQTAIERLAGGAPLANEEAMADYIISSAKGAAGGGIVTGALSGLARREQPPMEAPPEVAPAAEAAPAGPAEPLGLAEFIRANRAPGATGPLTAAEVKAARPDYEAYKQAFINEQFGVEALTPEQRNQILINQTPLEVPAPAVEPAPEAPTAFQQFPAEQAKIVVAPDQLQVEDISPAPVEPAVAPVQKTRIAEPVILGEQPAPVSAAPIITAQEAELLRVAEKEVGDAIDQIGVQEGVQRQRGEGAARGQAAAASAGDRVFGAAEGQEGRAQSVATKVALLKRQRGELLTNREAKLVRDYEKTAPEVLVPAQGTKSKFRGRQFGSAERRENFVNAYSRAVDSALADLVAQGVAISPNKLKRATSLLKRSAEAAVMAETDAAGAAVLDAEMGKALRGIIPKAEIETFRQKLADAAQAAMPETLNSRAAVDAAITSIEEFNANMPAFLRRPGWAIITGIQEKLGAFDTPANIAANAKLEAEMVARGLPFKKGPGKYLNVDQGDSFLVKMSEAEALDLAKRYGQQSVLTNEGYVYQNGSLTPVDHTKDTFGDEARKQDGYTEIDGKAFSLGLDFSQEIAKEDRVNPALPFAIHGIKAVHYSKTERSTLDGHRFGGGIKGAERERLRTADPRLRVRTSFYVSSGRGVFPEPGVGAVAHLSTLNNLYDADADPLHIWEGPSDANARELAVIEAGYAGYLARDTFDGQGAAVVFGRSDLPTKKVDAPNAVAEVPPAPKISEAQRARRAVAISKGYPAGAMPRSEWGDYVKRVNPEHYATLAPFGIFEGGEVVYRDGLLRGVQDPGVGRSRAAVDAAIIAKSDEIVNTIAGMVGTPKDLVVEAAPRVAGGAGMIQFGELRDMITVSLQASDAGSVAAHEGFHYLDKRVLTGPERRVVRQAFASGSRLHRMLVAKAEAYDAANGTDITSEIRAIPAEARAYGFEFWRRGELEAQGMIAKVFQKLARVMERIRNYIDGLGFTSYEDLFAMIRRGEYAKRDLSGIRELEREVMRSRAAQQAQTETPEFKAWFGDSKVVDAQGKPLVVYHGSPEHFGREANVVPRAFRNRPLWVTPAKDLADSYARGGSTAALYVSLENPANLTAMAAELLPVYNSDQELLSLNPDAEWTAADGNIVDNAYVLANSPAVMARLVRAGYDSVTVEEHPGVWSYGVLNPAQIKSATGNRGTFDPNDPNILHSKAATESIQDLGRRMSEGDLQREQVNAHLAAQLDRPDMRDMTERLAERAGFELSAIANSIRRGYHAFIGSGENRARASAGYRSVFNVMTHYMQRKSLIFERAIAKDLSTWVKGASRQDKVAVSKAMLTATVGSYSHDMPEYQALRNSLTTEQRAMMDQAWGMIGKMLDSEFEADARKYRKLFADDAKFEEWFANRKAQVDQLKKQSYFPERRYGDHFVHAYVEAPDGKKITMYYEQYEREAGATASKAELEKIFGAEGLKVEYGFKHKAEYDGSLSIGQFLDLAQRHGISLTQPEKERLGKALIAADSTRRNRVFRRQNVAGYSQDGMRVLAEFAVSMANKVAYSEMGDALQDALQGKQVDVAFTKEGTVTINTQEGTNVWDQDGPDAGFFRNLADEKVGFVMSPESRSTVSNKLRAMATVYFLGGSVAAAGVNLSSLPMITLPWLTQHTNPVNASAKLLDGMRVAGKHFKEIRDLPTLLGSTPIDGVDEVDGLRHALQIAAQDGSLFDTEIYQFMGLSRGQEYSLSGRTQEAVKLWMTPFRIAEQYNRVSAFIAAYKVAKGNNLANEAAFTQAQEAVYGTQFRYDEANRPALADSGVGSLFFVFKSFPIFMMETMTFLAKENPRSAVFMLGMLVLMAGVEGLPFAEDLEDLIDVIAQRLFGEPFNSKRWLRNTLKSASEAIVGADLSGVLMHGVANSLTGLNFASRVGAGNFVPGTRIGAADTDYRRAMEEILGPVGSMVSGIVAGGDALSKGDFLTAAKKGLPLAAKNAVKGWEQFEKGYATDAGGRKLVDVGSWEALWQSLGFSSSALAQTYESDSIDRRTSAFYTEIKGQFTKEMVKAIGEGDRAAANEVGMAVVAWNQAHPDMPIAMSPASIRRQVALAGMPLNQRTLLTMPRYLRGQSEAAIGLAAE